MTTFDAVKIRLGALRAADSLRFMDVDPVELVRSGYNAISRAYRGDDPAREYGPWLAGLLERIPGQGRVLDIAVLGTALADSPASREGTAMTTGYTGTGARRTSRAPP